jgi:hypothetical protein
LALTSTLMCDSNIEAEATPCSSKNMAAIILYHRQPRPWRVFIFFNNLRCSTNEKKCRTHRIKLKKSIAVYQVSMTNNLNRPN